MTYQTPNVFFDAFGNYTVVLGIPTPDQGTLYANMVCKFNADGFTIENVDEAFQKVLDFLNTSPDFFVGTAFRQAIGNQDITPTEPE